MAQETESLSTEINSISCQHLERHGIWLNINAKGKCKHVARRTSHVARRTSLCGLSLAASSRHLGHVLISSSTVQISCCLFNSNQLRMKVKFLRAEGC